MTKFMLEMEGCFVIEAADGMEALDAARASFPALILLDIHMPLMDGFEVARQLRKNSSTRKIPIVAVTAGHYTRKEAIEAGCDDCLAKPLLPDAIKNVLRTYIFAKSPTENDSFTFRADSRVTA
jgi:CheY-like chemotaxis protein